MSRSALKRAKVNAHRIANAIPAETAYFFPGGAFNGENVQEFVRRRIPFAETTEEVHWPLAAELLNRKANAFEAGAAA